MGKILVLSPVVRARGVPKAIQNGKRPVKIWISLYAVIPIFRIFNDLRWMCRHGRRFDWGRETVGRRGRNDNSKKEMETYLGTETEKLTYFEQKLASKEQKKRPVTTDLSPMLAFATRADGGSAA